MQLKNLQFIDLYIRIDSPQNARYTPSVKGDTNQFLNLPIPPEYTQDVENICNLIKEITRTDFSIVHDGVRMRGALRRLADRSLWVALRRISPKPPELLDLNYPKELAKYLVQIGKRDGLLIVSGATAAGKTTTCAALLAKYLNTYGGVAYTIEDPVEYNFQGEWGTNGYCFQTEISKDDEWVDGLKTALRWHPRFIYVGEIRTPEAADQVLRAASSGHFVITSLHASNIEEALQALLQVAKPITGERASQVLASALIGVLWQKLTNNGSDVNFMFAEHGNMADPVRVAIRDQKFAQMGTYIDMQRKRLLG